MPHWADRTSEVLSPHSCSNVAALTTQPACRSLRDLGQHKSISYTIMSLCARRLLSLFRSVSSEPLPTPLLTPGFFLTNLQWPQGVRFFTSLLTRNLYLETPQSFLLLHMETKRTPAYLGPTTALPHVHTPSEACHLPNILKCSRKYVITAVW